MMFSKKTLFFISISTFILFDIIAMENFTIGELNVEEIEEIGTDYVALAIEAYNKNDPKKHQKYLHCIPDKDKKEAYYTLAMEYRKVTSGSFGNKQNDKLIAEEFLKTAATKGNIDAVYQLGKIYFEKKDTSNAAAYFYKYKLACSEKKEKNSKQLARFTKSCHRLGQIYQNLAIEMLKEAAKNGSMLSNFELGILYEGQEKFDKAIKYYTRAIDLHCCDQKSTGKNNSIAFKAATHKAFLERKLGKASS